MSNLQNILYFLGTLFLICSFTDWDKLIDKAKKMKIDPDWIDFIIGAALLLLVFFFVSFFAYDLIRSVNIAKIQM